MTAAPTPLPRRLTPAEQDRRSDALVLVVVLAALIVGWFVKLSFQYRTESVSVALDPSGAQPGNVVLAVPETWAPPTITTTASLVAYSDPGARSAYKTLIDIRARGLDPDAPVTLDQVVDRQIAQQSKENLDFPGYQLLGDVQDTTVDGQPAKRIDFAYAAKPIDLQARNAPPVVVHAIQYIVIKNNELYVITETVDADLYEEHAGELQDIVESIRLP